MSRPPVAIVIGAGDATGGAIARRFAREGFTLCVTRRQADKLTPLVNDIESAGGIAHPFGCDARSEEQMVALFSDVERDIGPIEVVVFNIGANVNFPLLETTSRVFRKVWEMACFSGFLATREAARHMLPRNEGSIFITGATAGLRGGNGYAAFASAKFGIRAVAQAAARELGPQGIHVAHLVIDSGVDTEWVRERIAERAALEPADNPEPRVLMRPEAVAEAYWALHQQPRDAWVFEMEIRPYAEKW